MHQVCLYNFIDRTECFDDYYFPCRKRDNCKLEHHVSNWMMNQFVYMHNRMLIKGKIKWTEPVQTIITTLENCLNIRPS